MATDDLTPNPGPNPDPASTSRTQKKQQWQAFMRESHPADGARRVPEPAGSQPAAHVAEDVAIEPGRNRPTIESQIGGRWFAIAGALVFVVGIGFLVRLAVQEGWFGGLPPIVKCGSGAMLGVLMLGAAEFVRRRVNPWAAVGLNGAGLGAIFTSAYAAAAVYQLCSPSVSMILMGACTALGVAISAWTGLAPVAALALAGGYLTPILFRGDDRTELAMPVYLFALLAVGLVQSAWMAGNFIIVRSLSWFFTLILGGIWVWNHGSEQPHAAAFFLAACWLATNAEHLVSAIRQDAGGARPPTPGFFGTVQGWLTWRPVAASLVATTWAVGLAVTISPALEIHRWIPLAIAVGPTGIAGFALASRLRFLADKPKTAVERLGAGFIVQAAALVIAAIATALSGWQETVVWLAMGVAMMTVARWLASTPMLAYAGGLLVFATARLFAVDALEPEVTGTAIDLMGLHISAWSGLMMFAAATWGITSIFVATAPADGPISGILHDRRRTFPVSVAPTAVAIALAMASIVSHDSTPASIIAVWTMLGLFLVAMSTVVRNALFEWFGLGAVLAGLIVWYCTQVSIDWVAPTGWYVHPAFVSAMIVSLGLVVSHAVVVRRNPGHPWLKVIGLNCAASLIILSLIPSSLEVNRLVALWADDHTARRAAVSLWWAVYGTAALTAGFAMRKPHARYLGLALLAIAAVKVLTFDLVGVGLMWRTMSLLGVGTLMLGVAVGYGKVLGASQQHGQEKDAVSPGDASAAQG